MPDIHPDMVAGPRHMLISKTQVAKRCLITLLEGGERDPVWLRRQLEEYISLQAASDILAGYNRVIDPGFQTKGGSSA